VLIKQVQQRRPRMPGLASANSAAMPATCGVAMLVPLSTL